MQGKFILQLILISAVILSGCQKEQAATEPQPPSIGSGFCCGHFDESTGTSRYFWSADKNCGVPENSACAGSCPSVVENKYCQ